MRHKMKTKTRRIRISRMIDRVVMREQGGYKRQRVPEEFCFVLSEIASDFP